MFQIKNCGDGFLAHQLGRPLIRQVIAAFDSVKSMPIPSVVLSLRIVAQSRVDPPLGRDRMGAERMDLRNDGNPKVRIAVESCSQPGQPTPNDEDVLIDHSVIPSKIKNHEDSTEDNDEQRKDPKKQFFPADTEIDDHGPQAVQSVGHHGNDEQDIDDGVGMEHQSPVRFLFLCHQEESRCELDAQEEDEQEAANSMENPDKHQKRSF
jgi:hypothetical protein